MDQKKVVVAAHNGEVFLESLVRRLQSVFPSARIVRAPNGESAWEALKDLSFQVDYVVSAFNLGGGMNGLQLFKKMQANPACGRIKKCCFSDSDEEVYVHALLSAGTDLFIGPSQSAIFQDECLRKFFGVSPNEFVGVC